jgi:hypothetical protein
MRHRKFGTGADSDAPHREMKPHLSAPSMHAHYIQIRLLRVCEVSDSLGSVEVPGAELASVVELQGDTAANASRVRLASRWR